MPIDMENRARDIVEYALERATLAELRKELERRYLTADERQEAFKLAAMLVDYADCTKGRVDVCDAIDDFLKGRE